jgi:hypothetical protein
MTTVSDVSEAAQLWRLLRDVSEVAVMATVSDVIEAESYGDC